MISQSRLSIFFIFFKNKVRYAQKLHLYVVWVLTICALCDIILASRLFSSKYPKNVRILIECLCTPINRERLDFYDLFITFCRSFYGLVFGDK